MPRPCSPRDAEHAVTPQRSAYLAGVIARQQIEPQLGAGPTTPPVLTAFNAGTALNLGKAAAPFQDQLKGTDNLSGIKA